EGGENSDHWAGRDLHGRRCGGIPACRRVRCAGRDSKLSGSTGVAARAGRVGEVHGETRIKVVEGFDREGEGVVARAFSRREKVPEGRMRDLQGWKSLTRPSATFSRWERERATGLLETL